MVMDTFIRLEIDLFFLRDYRGGRAYKLKNDLYRRLTGHNFEHLHDFVVQIDNDEELILMKSVKRELSKTVIDFGDKELIISYEKDYKEIFANIEEVQRNAIIISVNQFLEMNSYIDIKLLREKAHRKWLSNSKFN